MKDWSVERCLRTTPPPVRTPLTSQIHPTNAGREVSPRAQGHGFCVLLGHCWFHYPVCWYLISKGDCLYTNGLPFERTQQFMKHSISYSFFLACRFTSASWWWLSHVLLDWINHRTMMQVSDLLDRLYAAFDALADRHGVYKIETIGDGNDHAVQKSPCFHTTIGIQCHFVLLYLLCLDESR